ncbi:hypothetical protein PHYBOEH_004732 [Phytophthora boehmeriae]|uniref:Myb-like DNA-binding protein n=1 Tax=Phytophthora boehmeriae TaxID=109152 RepID=A0A8T1X407_9STRA|nr:hypothetical protein PHYBOEH_004732 [Phytophthora boehmeriae]
MAKQGAKNAMEAAAAARVHGTGGSTYERRAWTRKEDDAIIRLVEEYGTKRWSVISDHLNGENHGTERTGKQCRTRWLNHLDPTIKKDPWTAEEEQIIEDAQTRLGNKTDNAIKNHWYSSMRRTMRRMAKQQNKSLGQGAARGNPSNKAAKFSVNSTPGGISMMELARDAMNSDSIHRSNPNFRHPMAGLSPKQATVYNDCYNALLKQADDSKMGNQRGAPKPMGKKVNSKRKRKDLRICTGSGGENSGMFLPDTPRRVLHTQLLLQLLNNPADEEFGTAIITVASATNKNKKRYAQGKKLGVNGGLGNEFGAEHGYDMEASLHSLDHLDLDFSEQVAEFFNVPTPQGFQPLHSLRRSPRFMSPVGGFTKADGTKFSFDDLDFPAELDAEFEIGGETVLRRSPRLRTDVSVAFPHASASTFGVARGPSPHKRSAPPTIDVAQDTFEFDHSITPTLKSPQLRQWLDGSPKNFVASV